MPRFEPFAGIRYDLDRVALADVVAPPYDVIDDAGRARLEARSPYNAVRVELATGEADGDPYEGVRRRFDRWLAEGVLLRDPEPSFYVCRTGWRDESGHPHQTTGVIGALELSGPDRGQVLPHERTMGKPKDDRLMLLRATRANLSAVWCLSMATGLSDLLETPGPPVARCTDDDGVHHRLWRITQPAALAAITDAVASAPVVIADGHHRFETAMVYRDECRAALGGARGDFDLLMALVVELSEDQLQVRPIHRLLAGLPDGFDLTHELSRYFELVDGGPPAAHQLTERMAQVGALGLIEPGKAWLLVPRNGSSPAWPSDHGADGPATPSGPGARVAAGHAGTSVPDAARLDAVLATLPSHDLGFHHSADAVAAIVGSGQAQAGVLLRPVPVDQIEAAARDGRRMPEKTTFFAPKPRTGLVFRRLDDH